MQDIQKLIPSSVRMPGEKEESYQAGLEVFHQLHCLVGMLRWGQMNQLIENRIRYAKPRSLSITPP